jgi:hypothetical protein
MSDNDMPGDLDLLIASMDDLAREIGEMEPDDPVRAERLKELYTLTELSKSLKTERNQITAREWMRPADELELKTPEETKQNVPDMSIVDSRSTGKYKNCT